MFTYINYSARIFICLLIEFYSFYKTKYTKFHLSFIIRVTNIQVAMDTFLYAYFPGIPSSLHLCLFSHILTNIMNGCINLYHSGSGRLHIDFQLYPVLVWLVF